MNKLFFIVVLGIGFFTAACNDSIYGGISDKNTAEALQDRLDFAFVDGNCEYVIDFLKPGAQANLLSSGERYKYNNAILACSGFDLVNSVGDLLSNNGSTDPFGVVQGLMGVDKITTEKAKELKDSYQEILNSCGDPALLDDNMKTVCGMTAAANTVLSVSEVAMAVSGQSSVKMTEEGLKSAVEGKSQAEIESAVNDSISNGILDLNETDKDLDIIIAAAGTIAGQAGENVDFSKDLEKLSKDLRGGGSSITQDSLSQYIHNQFGGGS